MNSTRNKLRTLSRMLLLGSVVSALVACGSLKDGSAGLPISSNGYLLTVPLGQSDTREAIASRFGGTTIVWLEGQRAVIELSQQNLNDIRTRGVSLQNTVLEENTVLLAPTEYMDAAGWNAWSGGWNAWAGGWNAWAGGWNAWAGGEAPPEPPVENSTTWSQIRLKQAQRLSRNMGSGIKVAVLDTGMDLNHPMLQGRLAPTAQWKDFVGKDALPQEEGTSSNKSYGHGTAVAGVIAQVAPKASLLPVRVLNPDGQGPLSNIVQGLYWAVDQGAQIINVSLGGPSSNQSLYDAVAYATARGVFVVASSGNDGQLDKVTFPARYSWWDATVKGYVFGVGSYDKDYVLSNFSNYGNDLFASAPGEKIITSFPGLKTVQATGTSFATPLVSGAVALAMGETNIDRAQFNQYLMRSLLKGGLQDTNSLKRGTTRIGVGGLDVESLLLNLPGFTPSVSPVAYKGTNMGFESLTTSGWYTNRASITTTGVRSGYGALSISSGGYAYRYLSNLKANTNYVATVWIKASGMTAGSEPLVWVSGYDSQSKTGSYQETYIYTATNGYIKVSLPFTTGTYDTGMDLEIDAFSGSIVIDDVSISESGY